MVSGYGVCAQHDGTELVGPPGVILLKARINRKRVEALVKAGVREKKRDENSLDAKHSAEAQALERQPQAYRDKADSGVPVFGKDGAKGVAVMTCGCLWRGSAIRPRTLTFIVRTRMRKAAWRR